MINNIERKNGHGVNTPENKVKIITAVGIPPERAHEVPDRVVKALAKRQGQTAGEARSLSIFDRLKFDLFENVAHLGNEARVVSFMDKWGLGTGSRKGDFEKARSLMMEAKESALALEKIDTQINAQHAIQDADNALVRASGNFLARAVAPAEVKNSLATLVTAAVLDQIGARLFKGEYDPSNGEQLMVVGQYMEMMFKAEESRQMIKPNVDHQKEMNRLVVAAGVEDLKNTQRNNMAELLGNSLKAPTNYVVNDLINKGLLGEDGTVVKGAEAISGTVDRLTDGALNLAEKVIDFAKKPEVWVSSGVATGVSLGFAVGPEGLPLIAGVVTALGLVGFTVEKIRNIDWSRGSNSAAVESYPEREEVFQPGTETRKTAAPKRTTVSSFKQPTLKDDGYEII